MKESLYRHIHTYTHISFLFNPCELTYISPFLRVCIHVYKPVQIEDEEDTIWTPEHRETPAEMARRGVKFLQWLQARPESKVAVVTHSAFLLTLFTQVLSCPSELQHWFQNAEMRSVTLQF